MSTTAISPKLDLPGVNRELADADPQRIVRWASETFGPGLVMTSSFGVQSAVMLHLVTRIVPDIPVIFIDTGYLFPETYVFADELTRRLGLNLKVYQAEMSPARMEALHGRPWEEGTVEALDRYDRLRKVEPMRRAISELNARAWLAGLQRHQTKHRAGLGVVEGPENGHSVYKVHPILAWTRREVHEYLKKHSLPYHPLFDKGYASIGDTHSTRPVTGDMHERDGRFQGLKQECGLHLPATPEEGKSRDSSDL